MRPPPTRYDDRVRHLDACHPRSLDGLRLGAGDLAFTLEGLGVSPEGFERVLRQAHRLERSFDHSARVEASRDYRIGVVRQDETSHFSGRPIGTYRDCTVLVWPKTESELAADRGGRRR